MHSNQTLALVEAEVMTANILAAKKKMENIIVCNSEFQEFCYSTTILNTKLSIVVRSSTKQ